MEQNGKIIGNAEELQYLLPGRSFHSTWASPEAFARYIEEHSASDCWCRDNAFTRDDERFYGTKTMADAIALAKEGWKEGAEKVEKLRSYIQALYPRAPRVQRHGLAGSTPNVPRAVAGNLFNMRLPEEGKSKKRPVITLISNMCVNYTVDKDVISNRAAALAAVVDQIESEGFSCEVISTALTGGGWSGTPGFSAATSVIVKRSDQPVDTMRLAFGLGHAAMFRRLVFADWQIEPSCKTGLGDGLGSARGSYSEEDLEKMAEKFIYFVPSAEGNGKKFADDLVSAEQGLPFIIRALAQQGCPAFKRAAYAELGDIKLAGPKDNGIEDDDDDC